MKLDKIEKLLRDCSLNELEAVERMLQELLVKAKITCEQLADDDGRKRRKEPRFETNMLGTLTRLTDVKPGERKEFSVTIRDVSRNGMKLIVDPNFIPSRVVEITFAAPGGKIKRSMLEIVRMRKMVNEDGSWLEIGCRSIVEEHVRRLRLQEEKIAKMRSKLHTKTNILVLVVGPDNDQTNQLVGRIKGAGYQANHITGLRQALMTAEKLAAQLAILCQGSQICEDEKMLADLKTAPPSLALLALVDNDSERFDLLSNGVDECLTRIQGHVRDDFLFHSMERALVGHVVRRRDGHCPTAKALVLSQSSSKVNLVCYQLEDQGYGTRIAETVEEAKGFDGREFDMVFADFNMLKPEEFDQVVQHFCALPVIALCDDLTFGHQSMSRGANNYLCMPPSREEMRMVLESAVATSSSM
ncbi:MAG: PilZ domain-containing protein [Sedimentisphaerales bacterium]|nr:PilZ domain-containing protein [Sedimentisphaerales bacterium]